MVLSISDSLMARWRQHSAQASIALKHLQALPLPTGHLSWKQISSLPHSLYSRASIAKPSLKS